ncbi:MAG TPA: hypothetical protein VN914_10910, partial [Polyangia bacterium]|nr:hypothetical protein [Polyangia bacterium]
STLNGIGTMLYGQSERDPDGTFIATLFFTFLFVPLVPISQYLVRPLGGRKWSFFGKVPPSSLVVRWRQAVAVGAAVVVAMIGWAAVESRGHSDVHFVNGLDVPVQIHAGKLDLKVGAGQRVMQRLATGEYTLQVKGADGRVLDEDHIKVPGGYDLVVYNVLGAAPLYRQPVTYWAESSGPPPKDDGVEPELHVGKKLVTEKDVDYVFHEQPKTIEMSQGVRSVNRTRFDLAPGGWKLSVGYLLSKKRNPEAAALVERVLNTRPDDLSTLGMAMLVVQRTQGREAMVGFAERMAKQHPDAVEIHRLYQNEMIMSGKRDQIVEEYRARFAKQPESALAGYLAGRLEPPDGAIAAFRKLLEKFPDDPIILRGLAGSQLQARQFGP